MQFFGNKRPILLGEFGWGFSASGVMPSGLFLPGGCAGIRGSGKYIYHRRARYPPDASLRTAIENF